MDGLTTQSVGLLAQGRPGLRPATPTGVIELLDAYEVELEGAAGRDLLAPGLPGVDLEHVAAAGHRLVVRAGVLPAGRDGLGHVHHPALPVQPDLSIRSTNPHAIIGMGSCT